MTGSLETDALSADTTSWGAVDWSSVKSSVRRLQMRIAKAIREGRHRKAKSLQWLLTHSHHGKLLAVRRVTKNSGSKTAGVDGVTWNTPESKEVAVRQLKRRGYQAQPLRRIYIPKSNGSRELRPLGIPRMLCRAQQALHLLALEPVVEMKADKHSYGFRPLRSTADAIQQCFTVLARKKSPQWILEGDIKACFDRICHKWLLANVFTDKVMLQKWLKAGYMERSVLYPTEAGTPQGGIISPAAALVALSGLEKAVKHATPKHEWAQVIAYADDFVITGPSKETLENVIKPAVDSFLKERGMELSAEKTKITHIDEGLDFLGFNIRKYKGKLLIKPSKKSVKRFLVELKRTVRSHWSASTEILIQHLNEKILGWSGYFRHAVAKKTFGYVDSRVFQLITEWIRRRHPNKSAKWGTQRYFRREGLRNWIFSTNVVDKKSGLMKKKDLVLAAKVPIKRHVKMRAEATPYHPEHQEHIKRIKAVRRCKMNVLADRVQPLIWELN